MSREIIVKEAMKTNLVMVEPSTTVLEAAKIMKKRKIGNVIIVENKQPIGILTESDILKKVVAEGKNVNEVLVKDVMTTPIVVIDPYVTLEVAMETMGKCNVRSIFVKDDSASSAGTTVRIVNSSSELAHFITIVTAFFEASDPS